MLVTALRAGIALLYAHWEGFIKNAAEHYLQYVALKKLTYQELNCGFVALAMKQRLDECVVTNKSTVYTEVVKFFLEGLSERA